MWVRDVWICIAIVFVYSVFPSAVNLNSKVLINVQIPIADHNSSYPRILASESTLMRFMLHMNSTNLILWFVPTHSQGYAN
jgi:hypothetical protein